MINNRINLMLKLKDYFIENNEDLQNIKELAERNNGWFTQEFISKSINNICSQFLDENEMIIFSSLIKTKETLNKEIIVGITMAGNIPLVGFHDFLCVFLSGHIQHIKLSSKDEILMKHIIQKLHEWDVETIRTIQILPMLKNCDAYIATGNNQTAKIFEQYFAKYPNIIRKNRTSVAILTGNETDEELIFLADDIYLYFGLGCRNVTKIYVPKEFNFERLFGCFKKYDALKNHNKFRNNIDYNLALYILNNQFYMSNESLLLVENKNYFSAISVLHYEVYNDIDLVKKELENNDNIQAIIGLEFIPFGFSQTPTLFDFADGVSTINFLNSL